MEKPKVSIVMPTYDVEKYFRQCIESVISQTLKEIEIYPFINKTEATARRLICE